MLLKIDMNASVLFLKLLFVTIVTCLAHTLLSSTNNITIKTELQH